MAEKILSVFIDESGDFGSYDSRAPFYLIAMVLHNQDIDISKNIDDLENHLTNLGYKQHAIHTGPLIRRESVYANDLIYQKRLRRNSGPIRIFWRNSTKLSFIMTMDRLS